MGSAGFDGRDTDRFVPLVARVTPLAGERWRQEAERRVARPMSMLALAAAVSFDPLRFFAGRTEGVGRFRAMFHRPREVRVHGVGQVLPDGLALAQRVEPAGKPATTRSWLLRQTGPGRYAGTLSDAVGPVTAETRGNRLHIAYRTAHRFRIEQWLTLAPDGRSATNRLVARRMGVVVARLDETITRVD